MTRSTKSNGKKLLTTYTINVQGSVVLNCDEGVYAPPIIFERTYKVDVEDVCKAKEEAYNKFHAEYEIYETRSNGLLQITSNVEKIVKPFHKTLIEQAEETY